MAYDTILFDMDGVLLAGRSTAESIYRQAAAAAMADFGVDGDGPPPAGLVEPDTIADVRTACDELGLPASPTWSYRERAATTLENEALVAGDRTTYPDTSVLSDLAETYALGVVSNNRHGTVRFAADFFEWEVDAVRGRYPTLAEFGRLKPDPSFIRWALERTTAGDALYVGDRVTDVQGARRVGIDAAFLARDDGDPPGAVEPDYTIESLEALPDILASSE